MSDSMDELRRLEAEATPGPWGPVVDHDQDEWWIYAFGAGPTLVPYVPDGPNFARSEADAALIVAMRNALPELLSERDKALGVVSAARDALTDCDLSQPATNSKSRREWCIAHQQWTPCAYADLAEAIATFDAKPTDSEGER